MYLKNLSVVLCKALWLWVIQFTLSLKENNMFFKKFKILLQIDKWQDLQDPCLQKMEIELSIKILLKNMKILKIKIII
jgi:hypothetical protein